MKVVVIGGSGLIGSKVVTVLRQHGHEVIAASPSQGVNTVTGEGLAEAVADAQVVVDVANSPSFEDKPAMFPSIFALGVAELKSLTGTGSGLMNMAIVGGAIIPLVQGVLADRLGIHHAFFLPVICYLYILFYALRGSTPNSERYANCLEVVYAAQGAGSNNRRYPNCLEIVQRSMPLAVPGFETCTWKA